MKKLTHFAKATLLLLAVTAGSAQAAVISYSLLDIGDFNTYTTANVGQSYAGTGFVGLYETRFVHLFGLEQDDYSKTALQVDISGITGAGTAILSASLDFVLANGQAATQDVTATSFTADGTLEHFWNAPDNLGQTVTSVAGQAANSIDVTALLQGRVTAGADWFGLHLQGSDVYQWTYTDSGGMGGDQAQVRLNVEYAAVPEPANLALLGLGLLGLMLGRARRDAV